VFPAVCQTFSPARSRPPPWPNVVAERRGANRVFAGLAQPVADSSAPSLRYTGVATGRSDHPTGPAGADTPMATVQEDADRAVMKVQVAIPAQRYASRAAKCAGYENDIVNGRLCTWTFITARFPSSWTVANGRIRPCWACWMITPGSVATPQWYLAKAPKTLPRAEPGPAKTRFAPRPAQRQGRPWWRPETVQGLERLAYCRKTPCPIVLIKTGNRIFLDAIEGRLCRCSRGTRPDAGPTQ